MTAARQLRRLTTTSSGSYDLVKALSKSGGGGRDSHDPADGGSCAGTVQGRHPGKCQPNSHSTDRHEKSFTENRQPCAELEHLFNKAVIDTTRRLQKAQELEALIGKTAIDELLATVLAKNGIDLQAARSAGKGYTDLLETVSEIEARKVSYMKGHQQNLLRQDLGKAPYNGVLPESHYNVQRLHR